MRFLQTLLLLLLTPFAAALPLQFGEPVALTDTRYGTTGNPDSAQLVSNGTETFLLWHGPGLRVTKVDGEKRIGKPLQAGGSLADAIWTGTHFLLIVTTPEQTIRGLLLDRNAEALGGPFPIANGVRPRIALNGRTLLLVYRNPNVMAMPLSLTGHPAGDPEQLHPATKQGAVAVAANGEAFGVAFTTDDAVKAAIVDDSVRVLREQWLSSLPQEPVTLQIAASGQDYLVAKRAGTAVTATAMDIEGRIGRTLTFDTTAGGALVAAWSGSEYHLYYSEGFAKTTRVRIDREQGLFATETTELELYSVSDAMATAAGVRVAASVAGGITVTSAGSTIATPAVTYSANAQSLQTAVALADRTMIFWTEHGDGTASVRSGIRMHDGSWRERLLPGTAQVIAAASDGQEVAILERGENRFGVRLLDRDARVLRTVAIAGLEPETIAWNGSAYVIAGKRSAAGRAEVVAVTLTRGGTLSQPAMLQQLEEHESIHTIAAASDGNGGTLVTFGVTGGSMQLPINSIRFLAVSATLQPVGPAGTLPVQGVQPAVAWNGTRYLLAWQDLETASVSAAQVTASGALAGTPFTVRHSSDNRSYLAHLLAVRSGSDVVLAWQYAKQQQLFDHELAIVTSAGHSDWFGSFDALSNSAGAAIAALPGGTIAHLTSGPVAEAPHHGSWRVTMRTAAVTAPPQRADAPAATVRSANGQLRVEWSAPQQPVDGYRVEYRVGNGLWLELGRWFDPHERVASWPWLKPGETYSFRVRGMHAGGPGHYSDAVSITVPAGKRRAVR